MPRRPLSIGWAVGAAVLVVGAMMAYLYWAQRGLDEYKYAMYVQRDYLRAHFRADGRWPKSLDGIETDLRTAHPLHGYVHRASRPVLTVQRADRTRFIGDLRFRWLLGSAYRIEVDVTRNRMPIQKL